MSNVPNKLWVYERFVAESNRIEGISRNPTQEELAEFERFLCLDTVKIADLISFVNVYQPLGAKMRLVEGRNVSVGEFFPPYGGERVIMHLQNILDGMKENGSWLTHNFYETLHPFTDGNGRSGRMLWAWQMKEDSDALERGFLQSFYYQTLQESR